MTTFLDYVGPDTPPQDCYSDADVRLHFNVKDYLLTHVYSITFDSLFLSAINYDFAFEISTGHDYPFRLKVRSPDAMAEKVYKHAEDVFEAAMAAYRIFVAKPRHDDVKLPAPHILVVDENGMSINLEEVLRQELTEETSRVASQVLTFEGKHIRARVIPTLDGTYIATVVHHVNGSLIIADQPFYDELQAKRFVDFYLSHLDHSVLPNGLEHVQERALKSILN
jgi:hypothetical protein